MSAENITAKALKCIDEIYPSADALNDTYFPVEDFLGEAVRWVIDVIPAHLFTEREEINVTNRKIVANVAYITPATEIGRIVYFRMSDWVRSADIIYEDSPLYRQQKNIVLRGTPLRPIVVRMMDGSIEAYTTEIEEPKDTETEEPKDTKAYHIPYDAEYIPEKAEDLCAWKLAEVVLYSMSDVQNASVCTARVNELLQQIAL